MLKCMVTLSLLGLAIGQGSLFQRDDQCVAPPRSQSKVGKQVYRVGVLADRGVDAAFKEFNVTFADYLTATTGAKFDPPIQFELKPLDFIGLFSDVEEENVDFIYANPSAFSCIASEYGANTLVSQISRRVVGGKDYDLTMFGGVIFTRADNDAINKVYDIKGHSIACTSISSLGSGQMQFRLLLQAGLSFLNCPSQVAFTSNQETIVNGVLEGKFEVGFVRTDQIERTLDASGNPIDKSLFKILGAQEGLEIDGEPFPFESSTPLYPEWNVASLSHVPDEVSQEVQKALLALSDHADVGVSLALCENNCMLDQDQDQAACLQNCADAIQACSTTPALAELALQAKTNGAYSGWRSTLSYFELRNMQEETGFITMEPDTGVNRCVRSAELYDAIICPEGKFLRSQEDVLSGCKDRDIECADGFQCLCTPCVQAFDVDVFPVFEDEVSKPDCVKPGCAKFAVCGDVIQGESITFKMVDNKKRGALDLVVNIIESETTRSLNLTSKTIQDELFQHEFSFDATNQKTGVVIIEILADGEQIPESPLRLQINAPDCVANTGDSNREVDAYGNCVCRADSVEIGDNCVPLKVLLPSIMVPLALLIAVAVHCYVDRKKKQADSVWTVSPDELHFDDPPDIIGRGTFGLVLLAEYRGTQVAVKRVIPPQLKGERRSNILGKGAVDESLCLERPLDISIAQSERPQRRLSASVMTFDKFNFEEADEEAPAPAPTPKLRVQRRASWVVSKVETKDVTTGTRSGTTSSSSHASGSTWGISSQASGTIKDFQSSMVSLVSGRSGEHSKLKADFMIEMRHLSKLRHPCITTVMGAVISPGAEPMLVMEYMDHGSLHDLLHNESMILDGEIVLPILRDIAQGIRFLHAANPQVIHGDLKAANVLVDSKFRAKVADFGLSQKKSVGATGTPLWMAPELLRGESQNNAASDVYSFGIILYEVFSRKDPYEGEDHREVLKLVMDPTANKRPPTPKSCPKEVSSLMTECLVANPGERPSAEELDMRLKRLDVSHVQPGITISSLQRKKQAQRAALSEELIFQVFPKNVAEALRDGLKVEAESFDCITCFFSDIVGFTTISTKLDPFKVSDMLDRLYMRFDDLSLELDLFKVDTIGDAYMAATNLHKDQPDHAARMAKFCIAVMKASDETLIDMDDPGKGTVQIRAGFHSGPIVADVVGSRSPKYTLFGDTINTASRMESNSLCGRIQCSDTSAELVIAQDPTITVVSRGHIKVKGKGEMHTFWIEPSDAD